MLTTCFLSTVFYIAASQLRRDLFSITIAILMSSVKKCWQVSIWKREKKKVDKKSIMILSVKIIPISLQTMNNDSNDCPRIICIHRQCSNLTLINIYHCQTLQLTNSTFSLVDSSQKSISFASIAAFENSYLMICDECILLCMVSTKNDYSEFEFVRDSVHKLSYIYGIFVQQMAVKIRQYNFVLLISWDWLVRNSSFFVQL